MSAAQVICFCLASFGVGVVVEYWAVTRYMNSQREHVRALKDQATALRDLSDKASDAAEQWKAVAHLNGAREEEERHRREVAERRLTLVRDNMHRERD